MIRTPREAMARASELVRAFVEAGFVKIHLDASMSCGGDAAHRLPLRVPQDWPRTDVRLSRSYIRHGGDGVRLDALGDSKVVRALERAMDADPSNWRDYIQPGADSRSGRLFTPQRSRPLLLDGPWRRQCDRRTIRPHGLRINPVGASVPICWTNRSRR
jgi:D-tagatose-1,6-bisphosphate aldolase subunit GatZ/KbaZ-like